MKILSRTSPQTSLSFRTASRVTATSALSVLAVLALALAPALAKGKPAMSPPDPLLTRAPWPAQRVVLLMPLTLGAGWNLDKDKAAVLLPIAEQKLQQAMQRTGKFSTTQLHRYNPIFLRGIQDKVLTREQVDALVANPTLDMVQAALAAMRFDQPPLVAQVTMEQVATATGEPIPTVTTQVSGKLYEAGEPTPIRDITLSSMPAPLYMMRKTGKKIVYVRRSASDRILTAADNAFNLLAREWVKPLDDIMLPEPVIETGVPAPGGTPATGNPATGNSALTIEPMDADKQGRPVIKVPPGQVLGTFPAA